MIATQKMWCIRRSFKRPMSVMKFSFPTPNVHSTKPRYDNVQFCHSFFPYLPLQYVSDSQVRLFCRVHHDAAIVMNPIPPQLRRVQSVDEKGRNGKMVGGLTEI